MLPDVWKDQLDISPQDVSELWRQPGQYRGQLRAVLRRRSVEGQKAMSYSKVLIFFAAKKIGLHRILHGSQLSDANTRNLPFIKSRKFNKAILNFFYQEICTKHNYTLRKKVKHR